MPIVEVPVGRSRWSLTVRDADLIPLPTADAAPIGDAGAAVVAALDHPVRFEAFRRALTPDDRIALVVDESLPRLADLVAGVLEYLAGAGIPPSAVTAISPAGSAQHWINDLPDSMTDLQTEIHRPGDRNRLSYLAATKEGHRIYLNRTLVDADQAVILTGRGYDPLLGLLRGVGSIYPGLADAESVRKLVPKLSPQTAPDGSWPTHAEAREVGWLLGSPFFVQVIEGAGDEIDGVVAGFADTAAEAAARLDDRWKSAAGEPADTVVVALSGDPDAARLRSPGPGGGGRGAGGQAGRDGHRPERGRSGDRWGGRRASPHRRAAGGGACLVPGEAGRRRRGRPVGLGRGPGTALPRLRNSPDHGRRNVRHPAGRPQGSAGACSTPAAAH